MSAVDQNAKLSTETRTNYWVEYETPITLMTEGPHSEQSARDRAKRLSKTFTVVSVKRKTRVTTIVREVIEP